jgi:hypothetical protein
MMLIVAAKKALPITDCPFINEVIALVISWVAG